MTSIEKIDPNFAVKVDFDAPDMVFFNALTKPFRLYGLLAPVNEEDCFRRMPQEIANQVSPGVLHLHSNTAGGRLRFRTDSTRVAIFATMGQLGIMPHFPLSGSAGFDLYINNKYHKTFMPSFEMPQGLRSMHAVGAGEKEITINFPLYSDVRALAIGLDAGASVAPPADYRFEKPVVYYGSSITQGGCASRPGNAYQAIISRRLDCDFINLGFSGNAKGEPAMAEYISSLSMQAFVYDYDHNAPTPEHLEATHAPMFRCIRERHPELPVIMVSRPNTCLDADGLRRRDIIKATWQAAREAGDSKVWFVDGCEMMRTVTDDNSTTVDGCHPTDFGFFAMAKGIGDALAEALG